MSTEKDKIPTFRKAYHFLSFKRCTSEKEVRTAKIVYLIALAVLIAVPVFLANILSATPVFTPQEAEELNIAFKGIVILLMTLFSCVAIWIARKLGVNWGTIIPLAIILIFLPWFFIWVPAIIGLTILILIRKPAVETVAQDRNIE